VFNKNWTWLYKTGSDVNEHFRRGITKNKKGNLFILDEPTVGLANSDITKIGIVLNELVEMGSTIIIIDHNQEFIIKNADYIIDLGCYGGNEGGKIVFQGNPTDVFNYSNSSWYKAIQ